MDKRSSPRNRVLKAGTIEFDGGSIPCMIRNMSDTGAMLDVATAARIPKDFALILQGNRHHTPCRVVWWKEKRIGVTFE